MAEALEIQIVRSADQRSITITDLTDWTSITGVRTGLTSIVISFFTTDTSTSIEDYTFTASELSEYTQNGTIILTFETIFSTEFITDNWYIVQMDGNSGDYLSNYEGFGTYYYTKNLVYNKYINGLRTPEQYRDNMESIYMLSMYLKGLKQVDTSNINSSDIKFTKRLSHLTKMIS